MSEEQQGSDIFSSFMKSRESDEVNSSTESKEGYKVKSAKERLQEIKEEEKRKEQEETEEAKRDSIFKASRINQSMVVKRQAQHNSVIFVIIGVVCLVLTLGVLKIAPKFSSLISSIFNRTLGV